MSRTTSWDADLECIDLQDLLNAKAQQILAGQFQQDPHPMLVELAQEALGWQNWARDNSVPLLGNPMVLIQQAARKMELGVVEANAAFAGAQAQEPMPALYGQGGDVACWKRIAALNSAIYQTCCPEDLQTKLSERESLHQQSTDFQAQDSQAHTRSAHFPDASAPPSIRIEVESQGQSLLSPEQQRDRALAQMGREIVQIAGTEEGGKLTFEGKANYTITVNLNTNTMRIDARDRGEEPILVDRDGNIDHRNSRVTDRDVDKFKRALQVLRQQQPSIDFER